MTMTTRSFLALVTLPLLAACPSDDDVTASGTGSTAASASAGTATAGDGSMPTTATPTGGNSASAGGSTESDTGTSAADTGDTSAGTGGSTSSADDTGSSSGSDGGEECTKEQCGPAPGEPNFLCDDGVTVAGPVCGMNGNGECGWSSVECPTCCYEDERPMCNFGSTCCDDGSWACDDQLGNPTCNGATGTTCECCDPDGAQQLGCFEGASCCAGGEWECDDGGGGSACEAPGAVCSGGGAMCESEGGSCVTGPEVCCQGFQCCTGVPVPPGAEYCSQNCPVSDRNKKENFVSVDTREVLDLLLGVPLSTWNYTFEDEAVRHIGPMAQDFKAAFEVGSTDKRIYTIDADGVALASIQALHGDLQALRTENAELKAGLKAMAARLDTLEKR